MPRHGEAAAALGSGDVDGGGHEQRCREGEDGGERQVEQKEAQIVEAPRGEAVQVAGDLRVGVFE